MPRISCDLMMYKDMCTNGGLNVVMYPPDADNDNAVAQMFFNGGGFVMDESDAGRWEELFNVQGLALPMLMFPGAPSFCASAPELSGVLAVAYEVRRGRLTYFEEVGSASPYYLQLLRPCDNRILETVYRDFCRGETSVVESGIIIAVKNSIAPYDRNIRYPGMDNAF